MRDINPQTAKGKVLWHFTMSLDGYVAGPGHSMDWMGKWTARPGLVHEYTATTGAILGGRDGWDAYLGPEGALRRVMDRPRLRPHSPSRGRGAG